MKILVPVDGSACSNAALAFVASRTSLIGERPVVQILNVQMPLPPRAVSAVGREIVSSYYATRARPVLKPAEATLRRAGYLPVVRHAIGSPSGAIAVAASKADLVVMGSHGHSALKGLIFGSVTNGVLAGCRTPLLVVRQAPAPARDSLRVGIALDGSAFGLAALRYVVEHRALLGANPILYLIHAVPDLFSLVIPGVGDAPVPLFAREKVLAAQATQTEQVFAPAQALLSRAGLQADTVQLSGNNAGDAISHFASRRRLNLLVMGSHGRGLLKSAVLGSVATRVAARCATPLLLVRRPVERG